MRKIKNVGLHAHRLEIARENPEEVRFAKAWNERNNEPRGMLAYLLDPSNRGYDIHTTDRDRVVAATVIQWLGSMVGRWFLEDLGYKKVE